MRDRESDLDTEMAGAAWDERPVVGNVRGLPWWAAVLLALGLAAVGAFLDSDRLVDDQRLSALGTYQIAFLAGCVIAVLAVRRRNLFGPMVQPPLIFAVTFVITQLTARSGPSTEQGLKKFIFEVGLPLATCFPWMAGATIATIVLGLLRLAIQRDPNAPARKRADDDADDDSDDRPPPRREPAPARKPARDRDDRAERGDRSDRGDQGAQQPKRRDPSAQQRRPARDDRGEPAPRRNPPRDREQSRDRDKGRGDGRQRRRPRDDYRD
jgi:hypothetical protein